MSYLNIFECGTNILNKLDVKYERKCTATMFTPRERYYTKMLETLFDYNDHNNTPLSNDNIRQEISTIAAEE